MKLLRRNICGVALPFLLLGCGAFYSADIAGYIRDTESNNGIDGALIRVYLQEPASADEEDFIVETASMTSNGNPGYYSHRIVWQNIFPAFGNEGDSGDVWLGIMHEDYSSSVVHVQGVISDTLNLVPDIVLDRASFSTPEATGRIVDVSGDGINGVRLILDLASTTENAEDYVTTTTTSLEGTTGQYSFPNVTWRDEAPDSAASDTETATIIVDDPDWVSALSMQVTLTSGQISSMPEDIVATRKPRTDFSITLRGRCINRTPAPDIQDLPAQGVEVTLTYRTQDGTLHTLYDQSDVGGNYSFLVQWTDDSPGDFDGPVDGSDDASIPEGEDGLYIQAQFNPAMTTPDIDGGDPATFDASDFLLKSWLSPNYLPDAVTNL